LGEPPLSLKAESLRIEETMAALRKAAKVVPEQLRKVMNETVDTQCA